MTQWGEAPDPESWTLYSAHGRQRDVDRCLVMAILNATPDSFSDGGMLAKTDLQVHARGLLAAEADILDVGGESTRPGYTPVPADEEVRRVMSVIEAIRAVSDAWISIDTSKAAVAQAAIQAGADFVNDVRGLEDRDLARLVAQSGCSAVVMRHEDCTGDIVRSCRDQLQALDVRARMAGIAGEQIILDPGLGFGSRPGAEVEDNERLIDEINAYAMGHPVMIGASRKRFVRAMHPDLGRDEASIQVALQAQRSGAAIVRVHDVAGTVAALRAD